MLPVLVLLCLFSVYSCALQPSIVTPIGYNWLRRSNQSTLYTINLPNATGPVNYAIAPYLLVLRGSRYQIGYDYAALLNQESLATLDNFVSSLFSPPEQLLFFMFVDYLWDTILVRYTPPEFLEELRGMQDGYQPQGVGITIDRVATRFYTFANLPADPQNIIAMLEQELEGNWPFWLKTAVNDIIALLEKLYHGCDAFGVWGSRTKGGLLYSSRNLDFNSNTGIDNYKLVTYYHINDPKFGSAYTYNSIGFAFGLGALAGMSAQGVTVSEMNLDNSDVTFSGLAFPLRLRYILERSTNLQEAMTTWNATNNTNSFNFLIGSANDAKKAQGPGAFALETMMGFTAVYGDNNPIEAASRYYCGPSDCKRWTNQTGWINIGKPIKEAVFRSNHGFSPVIMSSQEPLFNNTVFRYNLMHDLFVGYQKKSKLITDFEAVYVAASAATKGDNYFSCDAQNFKHGDNVMSITYAPGARSTNAGDQGHFYIAWEQNGLQPGTYWRPAACNSYVLLPMNIDPHLELVETMRLTDLVKQKQQEQVLM